MYTGKTIHPDHWNTSKGKPKSEAPNADLITLQLNKWEYEIERTCLKREGEGKPVSMQFIKNIVPDILDPNSSPDISFFSVWDKYIELKGKQINKKSKKVRQSSINAYGTTRSTLEIINGTHPGLQDKSMARQREFISAHKKYNIEFGSINDDFVSKLEDYTMFMGFQNEFCHRHLGRVKTFMRWAVKKDHIKDTGFENLESVLPIKDDDANIYFLMGDELAYLNQMKLDNERLAKVRDLFCFQCYTGFRISEVLSFRKENHDFSEYDIIEIKTRKRRKNPLAEPAIEILKRYKDLPGPYALPQISPQKYNEYLGELAQVAGLDRKINRQDLSGSDPVPRLFPLYDVISSHVGRKTYVTYLINSGKMDKNVVRAWTGQSAAVIDRYYERLAEYKKEQMEKLNKQYKKDAAKGRKLRKI